jgi:hypothetical protein
MIWHIAKKDIRQVWRYAVALAVVQLGAAAFRLRLGAALDFNSGRPQLMNLLEGLVLLGTGFVITVIVHQDVIPGVRQDWLVRPIARRDLLAAKIVSVLLLVHGPMLVADLFFSGASGVSIGRSLSIALSQNGFVFAILSLPLLAMAAMTRNMMEAIAGLLGALACAVLIEFGRMFLGRPPWEIGGTWTPWTAAGVILFIGASIVLGVQYACRRTRFSIGLTCAAAIVAVLITGMLPARPAYALEDWLSPNSGPQAR